MIIQQFPEEVIELNRELATDYHPGLKAILHTLEPGADFTERLGHIAAYCELVLDGMYSPDDIVGICAKLVDRLKERRVREKTQTIITLH